MMVSLPLAACRWIHWRQCTERFALALTVALALATGADAQGRNRVVAEAAAHRDSGNFAGAIRLLEPYVARNPGDAEAARVLAQSLHWAKRPADAQRVYDEALRRHPGDAALRLEYGRMLAETGRSSHAREVVSPVRNDPEMRPYAEALLGTVAYWEGDYPAARRLLRSAVAGDASLEDAWRQLGEIAALGAPWVSLTTDLRGDDQPLGRADVQVAGGWSATPLLALTARGGAARLQSGDSLLLEIATGEVGFTHYAPAARLESGAAIGFLQRGNSGSDWTGHARVGLRLPAHVAIRGMVQREPYFYTIASLRTPVTTQTATVLAALASPRGWSGELAVQRAIYPDDNAVQTAYAWVLAPLVWRGRTRLQVGYGASMQDSEQSRFVLNDGSQPYVPGDPLFNASGHYTPYYTPLRLAVHNLLASAEARPGRAVTLRAGVSLGVRATDESPIQPTTGSQPGPRPGPPFGGGAGGDGGAAAPETRSFSPWSARAGLDFMPTGDLTLAIAGEASQTPFYTAATARAQLTYRWGGAAMRRAARR